MLTQFFAWYRHNCPDYMEDDEKLGPGCCPCRECVVFTKWMPWKRSFWWYRLKLWRRETYWS